MVLYIETLANIKADLGIPDTTDDAVLTRWLLGLQGRFDMHCRRVLLKQTDRIEIFDGDVSSLMLDAFPVESVSEVVIDADQDWTNANSILSSDDYLIASRRGRLLYGRGDSPWPAGNQCIRVTYTGGLVASDGTAANAYVDEAHVQALKRAFAMQSEFEWRNRTGIGVSQMNASGVVMSMAPGVPLALKEKTLLPEVETVLAPLVRYY